jgi:hypothetical protein
MPPPITQTSNFWFTVRRPVVVTDAGDLACIALILAAFNALVDAEDGVEPWFDA